MNRLSPALALAALLATTLPAPADHAVGHTETFAAVPSPGAPEGIAVRDGVVFVGTHVWVGGNAGGPPSKIFTYDLQGTPIGELTIEGQGLGATHGILGMAFDAAGRLYVLDRNPPRVIRIDLASGAQATYATIPNLPACATAPPGEPCAPVTVDEPAFPDYLAFAADGSLYVTDLQAATIFRVPAGGGAAQIWFQDPRLDSIFGPNGIAVGPDGMLYFAMTGSTRPGSPAQGIIYRLPLVADPAAADLEEWYRWTEPAVGPDGIAFGASGRLYVALAGSNQVSVLEPAEPSYLLPGQPADEVARFPATPLDNAQQEIPYDLPASVAFDGSGGLLVTNQSFFANDSSHWAVLRAWVGDVAWPLVEPVVP